MSFKKKTLLSLWGILIAVYLTLTIAGAETWCNIISPVCAFAAAGILIYTYFKADRGYMVSLTYLLYALAFIAWGAADTLWAVFSYVMQDPSELVIIHVLYLLPNIFLLTSITLFTVSLFSKWNAVQSAVDSVIIAALMLYLIWIVFFSKDLSVVSAAAEGGVITVVSIIADILIMMNVVISFLSIRSGKIPAFILMIASGLFLYAVCDLIYFYQDIIGVYFANSFIDFAYMVTMQLIAFGAVFGRIRKTDVSEALNLKNSGVRSSKRWHYLMVTIIIMVVFEGFVIVDILAIGFLILLYRLSGNYIQTAIENERLLENQKNMNATLEQRVAEQLGELAFLANRDTLTALYNRRYFMTALDNQLITLRDHESLTVFLIDVDRFKHINDSYGHDAGDMVLIEISQRLIAWNSYGATLARLGGDEFAAIIAGKFSRKDIEEYSLQIIKAFGYPITVGDVEMKLTVSLGAALNSGADTDSITLLKNADIAMYRAKAQGYNKFMLYDEFFNMADSKKIEIEKMLRKADYNNEFELFFQPQFSLPDKKLIGAEALLRWKSNEYGYIPPNEFIPIAEEIDHIFNIGQWVMNETISRATIWNTQYGLDLKLGFNISPKQFNDVSFVDSLKSLVLQTDFNTGWIDAEITESVMIKEEKGQSIFELFNSLGISVSVDDFGTGYSSLGYLNSFPFDRIKIDKTLIDNTSPDNYSGIQVVKAIIAMANALGITTIAEGVETEDQLDILIKLGCDQVQGYIMGRPVPAAVFEEMFIINGIEAVS